MSTPHAPSVRRLSVGEVTLEVTELGVGDPVVLLHGFPAGAHSWEHQLRALADAGFRAIAPDQRGYAGSDKPREVAAYRVERLAADVVGLLDALELPRAHLVGHDWGGAVAWATASLYPGRVERLAVMNGPHPRHAVREIFTNPAQLRRSWYVFLFQVPFVAEQLLVRRDIGRVLRASAAHPEAIDDALVARCAEAIRQPDAARAMLSWYRAAIRYRLPTLPPVLARTLYLWGDLDPAFGPRLAQHLDRYARDVEVRHLPDAGHWPQLERPAAVNRHLVEFLRR